MARRKRNRPTLARAEVVDLAHDGRGVAKVDGKTVFVHGALPGEDVSFTIYRRKRSFDEAIVEEIHVASQARIEPKCEAFGVCGGCVLQHLGIEEQRAHKRAHLEHEFKTTGAVEPITWLDDLYAEPWNYRRRGRLGIKQVPGKGRVLVGFRERRSPFIADMHRCEILAKPVDGLLDALSSLVGTLSIPDRIPQVELAVGDDVTALVFRHLDPLSPEDLAKLDDFAQAQDVDVYLQPGGLNTVAPLGEARRLSYRLPEFDLELDFSPLDFIQVNSQLNRRMMSHVIAQLDLQATDRVLDLFCGLGNFSLPLARVAGHVVGVEGELTLVERARANAAQNSLENTEFHVANLFEPEPQWSWLQQPYDAVLIDPPRAGAQEILPLIHRAQPRKIAYVSCHPATLARDAGILQKEYGYRLTKAGIMDMFPHTGHVESVAIFERS